MTFLWPSFSSSLELVQVCIKASFTKLPAREIIPAPKSSYRTSSGWFPSFYICLAVYFLSHLFPVSAFPLVVFSVSVGFLFHYRVVFMLQNRAACLEIFQLVEFSICVCLYMRVSVSHRLRENVFMNHSGFGPIAWIGTSFVSSSNQKDPALVEGVVYEKWVSCKIVAQPPVKQRKHTQNTHPLLHTGTAGNFPYRHCTTVKTGCQLKIIRPAVGLTHISLTQPLAILVYLDIYSHSSVQKVPNVRTPFRENGACLLRWRGSWGGKDGEIGKED